MDTKNQIDSEGGSCYARDAVSLKMPQKLISQNLRIIFGSFISRYK